MVFDDKVYSITIKSDVPKFAFSCVSGHFYPNLRFMACGRKSNRAPYSSKNYINLTLKAKIFEVS